MIISIDTLKSFSGATEKQPFLAEPFSWRRWSFAASRCLMVRVRRIDGVAENKFGRTAAHFLEWNFPPAREVEFVALPAAPARAKTIAIGGRIFNARLIRMLAMLPQARIAIAKGERAAMEAEAEAKGHALPTAFVFGEGRSLHADGCGLLMPMSCPQRKATA
jgi:hypothetical protein